LKPEAGGDRPATAGAEQYRSPVKIWGTKIFHPHACPQNPFVTFAQNFPGFETLSYSETAELRQATTAIFLGNTAPVFWGCVAFNFAPLPIHPVADSLSILADSPPGSFASWLVRHLACSPPNVA